MSRLNRLTTFLSCLVILWAFSSNPPQGRTGGPGERTCSSAGCHIGANASIQGHLELLGLPKDIQTNQVYDLNLALIVDDGTPESGGFQMMSLSAEEEDLNGFINPGSSTTISMSNERHYFEHDPALPFDGMDTLLYPVEWMMSDSISTEYIVFYAAAIFANGNNAPSGDRLVTLRDTFFLNTTTFSVAATVVAPACNNQSNGSISLEIMGNTDDYEISWNTGDSASIVQNLGPGNYNVMITENGNLLYDSTFVLNALDLLPPLINCVADTLEISSCVRFSYPMPSVVDNCTTTIAPKLIEGKGTNQSFEPGYHTEIYEAVDESGNVSRCTLVIHNNVTINADLEVNPIPCADQEFGSLGVKITGDNPPFDLELIGSDLSIEELPEGSYDLKITDGAQCTMISSFTITRPDSLQLEIVTIKNATTSDSGDGAIEINIAGGTPPYEYTWRTEDEDFSTEEDLSLLFPGIYSLEVVDALGCSIKSDSLRIDVTSSIASIELSNNISIAPNPVYDFTFIKNQSNFNIESITLVNTRGQEFTLTMEKNRLNLSHLRDGLDIVLINFEDGRIGMKKLLKVSGS